MGKIQIIVQFVCDPDFTDLYSAVVRRIFHYEIWFPALSEEKFNILEEARLIVFYCKVIVSVACSYQIVGNIPLGQQGIGSNGVSFDIDSVEQRDRGFDFIGTFEFVTAVYGQGTYFFWVRHVRLW